MNVKKKVVSALAIVLAIAAISAITLPALVASDNTEQGTETSPDTCDQTCTQDRVRLRDGSCGARAHTDMREILYLLPYLLVWFIA